MSNRIQQDLQQDIQRNREDLADIRLELRRMGERKGEGGSKNTHRTPMVYVCGPHRSITPEGVDLNIRAAETVSRKIFQAGAFSVCPHVITRGHEEAQGEEFWLRSTLDLLRKCDAIVILDGWEISEGCVREVQVARDLKIPLYWVRDKDVYERLSLQFSLELPFNGI